jgi:lysophospholipase
MLLITLGNCGIKIMPDHLPYYKHSSEKKLHIFYGQKISPHYQKSPLRYFKGQNNFDLAYKIFKVEDEKAAIVISSGRTESLLKYQELIFELNSNGYSVYIYDHRGQGFSQRINPKKPQMGDVESFDYYVRDLNTFVEKIVKKEPHKKLFLLSHSMGGAIASLYLEQHTGTFDAAVLSSPMHQPKLISKVTTDLLCNLLRYDPKHIEYAPGESGYSRTLSFDPKLNIFTHSMIRFAITENEYANYKKVQLGGPSTRWVVESCHASRRAVSNADKIKTPFLLLQAGSDKIVNLSPQEQFCSNNAKMCFGYKIPGAAHELFMESDTYRDQALSAVLTFFDNFAESFKLKK